MSDGLKLVIGEDGKFRKYEEPYRTIEFQTKEDYDALLKIIEDSKIEKKITIEMAMKVLKEALKEDKSEGSYYYSWKANIACAIMDNSEVNNCKANGIAIKFLERLIK